MALFGRLFPDRRFQIFNKLIIAFLICHGLVFFFIIMFQCTPVAGIWNNTIRQHCVDITAVALASAILSIIEDLVILAMPIQQLRNLQLKFKKKLAVGFMLSLGSLACLTSIIRLRLLVVLVESCDITWDNVDAVKWSITEISCALICGSLPALQPVFRKVTGLLTTIRGSRPTAEMMGPAGKGIGHFSIRKKDTTSKLRSPTPETSLSDSEDSMVIKIHMATPLDAWMKPLSLPPLEFEPLSHQLFCRDSDRSSLNLWIPRTATPPRTPITLTTPTSVRSPRREANAEYELDLRGIVGTKTWM
ncbi:putative integral membrane protein [Colletotrichum sublineola]|uniref:Putative integral membrane protein n=1 Tax=Colletotrichum sublineola TaxID=1173701 RepID=A0A066XHM9_COLSU|nr:putative integral membrane protein [Colletotrichum sublineola]